MSTRRDSLFELRSYAAQPGQRDALIGMFESLFLDAYQASGARIANVEEAILLRAVRADDFDELFAPPSGTPVPDSLYQLVIYSLAEGHMPGPTASFITDRSENSYPRQPVRSDSVCVTLTRLASMAARETHAFIGKLEVMRLAPSSRSALR